MKAGNGKRVVLAGMLYGAALLLGGVLLAQSSSPQPVGTGEEVLQVEAPPGRYGGRLVAAVTSDPRGFNPVTAADRSTRAVTGQMMSDLVHINRATQQTELALAESVEISQGGRRFIVRLRKGLRFSDGHPFDADDVVFSYQVYLDDKVNSPQQSLLLVEGKPVQVTKVDALTVRFDFARPYAVGDRLFDGFAILPEHLLGEAYREGNFGAIWDVFVAPAQIAGLGPYRLKEYRQGERIILERNPFYWKVDSQGNRLPYLDEIVFLIIPSPEAQAIRFLSGELDVIDRLSPGNFQLLGRNQEAQGLRLVDLGPGLDHNFLFFNLSDLTGMNLPEVTGKQAWFRKDEFRRAVSAVIDREAIVRLVFQGRGIALRNHVTPGNRLWWDPNLPPPPASVEEGKRWLVQGGFSWRPDGTLVDGEGRAVEFTVITSAGSPDRVRMTTIIEQDLRRLGMKVRLVSLDSRAYLDRILNTRNYDASVIGIGAGDVDPNTQLNVLISSGHTHVWDLGGAGVTAPWQTEIDDLMKQQQITMDSDKRKELYYQVQALVSDFSPFVSLASPHILVGARSNLKNFQPAILDSLTLWNSEVLCWIE